MDPIFSTKDDTLETILEKINSGETIKEKLGIYTMFTLTKSGSVNEINMYIQLKNPELWKEIKKINGVQNQTKQSKYSLKNIIIILIIIIVLIILGETVII
tara:strand:- start:245 stop:547 length:303 start_codon:yes stop_codon:yes gene_type:complete